MLPLDDYLDHEMIQDVTDAGHLARHWGTGSSLVLMTTPRTDLTLVAVSAPLSKRSRYSGPSPLSAISCTWRVRERNPSRRADRRLERSR